MCSGGIDISSLILDMVKLNGDRVRWKDPLSLNGNSRRFERHKLDTKSNNRNKRVDKS